MNTFERIARQRSARLSNCRITSRVAPYKPAAYDVGDRVSALWGYKWYPGVVDEVLEGGYKEDALGSCACACVAALLGDDESVRSAAGADAPPPPPLNAAAVAAVKATAAAHRPFWSCLRELARADPGAGGSSE